MWSPHTSSKAQQWPVFISKRGILAQDVESTVLQWITKLLDIFMLYVTWIQAMFADIRLLEQYSAIKVQVEHLHLHWRKVCFSKRLNRFLNQIAISSELTSKCIWLKNCHLWLLSSISFIECNKNKFHRNFEISKQFKTNSKHPWASVDLHSSWIRWNTKPGWHKFWLGLNTQHLALVFQAAVI